MADVVQIYPLLVDCILWASREEIEVDRGNRYSGDFFHLWMVCDSWKTIPGENSAGTENVIISFDTHQPVQCCDCQFRFPCRHLLLILQQCWFCFYCQLLTDWRIGLLWLILPSNLSLCESCGQFWQPCKPWLVEPGRISHRVLFLNAKSRECIFACWFCVLQRFKIGLNKLVELGMGSCSSILKIGNLLCLLILPCTLAGNMAK